jgi:hypothetical protein
VVEFRNRKEKKNQQLNQSWSRGAIDVVWGVKVLWWLCDVGCTRFIWVGCHYVVHSGGVWCSTRIMWFGVPWWLAIVPWLSALVVDNWLYGDRSWCRQQGLAFVGKFSACFWRQCGFLWLLWCLPMISLVTFVVAVITVAIENGGRRRLQEEDNPCLIAIISFSLSWIRVIFIGPIFV